MKKQIINVLSRFFIFTLCTLVTQIGGIVYLLCLPLFYYIDKLLFDILKLKILRNLLKITLFCGFYALTTFIIVPPLAIHFGRVAMPYDAENPYIRQGNFGYVLLNRHYVTPFVRPECPMRPFCKYKLRRCRPRNFHSNRCPHCPHPSRPPCAKHCKCRCWCP